ncbi:MAG: TonB-dependent receptor [Deltaproteobacteria bacterium]|jgi:iron complex outermembrane receptor protein|nr:TonB-dependent receptor [Deltaproteobacteria bacterium]
MTKLLCGAIMVLALLLANDYSIEAQNLEEVRLEPIEFSAPKDTVYSVTQTDIERKGAINIWQALSGVPGITQLEVAGRNETAFSIRGSTTTQVGMYLDDIPVATAYRNQFDFNNVLVFDAETIDISKGYSTPLLNGGFGLAGILNVKTHKPTRALEFKAQYKNYFDRQGDDQGRFMGVRIGTKQDLFYLQVSAVQDEQDFFRLSKNFSPGYFEKGGRRVNSDYRNRRLNAILGFTPTEKIDIMFGTILQDFVKGQPITAQAEIDPNYTNLGNGFGQYGGTRLWRWPEYETKRYFVNANMDVGEKTHIQLVAYLDKHKDMIESYTRLIGKKPAAPQNGDSGYDQYTSGIRGRFDHQINPSHKISWSVGYRKLSHKEIRDSDGVMSEHIQEHYWDLGGEYSYKPIEALTAVLGLSYSRRTPDIVDKMRTNSNVMIPLRDQDMDSNDLFDYQLGLFYDLPNTHQIYLTYARKSRFPSMWERFQRDRYSATFDDAMSFDLKPEKADHFEVGYRGVVGGWLKFSTSAFYTTTKDKITMVSVDFNSSRFGKNIDKATVYGLEAGVELILNKYVTTGASLTVMDWKTDTSARSDSLLTDIPKTQGSIYAVVSPMNNLSITAQANMRSDFYISSDPDNANCKAPGFFTADLKATYDINEYLTVELGAKNIFDKNYYLAYYYPLPGRSFFLGLTGNY